LPVLHLWKKKTLLLFLPLYTLPIPFCQFSFVSFYLADQCADRESAEDDLSITIARRGLCELIAARALHSSYHPTHNSIVF